MFPEVRLRRNRQYSWLRDIVAETIIAPQNLIYPLFIVEGSCVREPIGTLHGINRVSIDEAIKDIKHAYQLGIRAVALFPVVDTPLKTEDGSEAYKKDNLISRSIIEIKNACPNIGLVCDVALDPYTTHGHDGVYKNNDVENDLTLFALQEQALNLAEAGVDIIAPSDMMDGRIGAIRAVLDQNHYEKVLVLSYAAKYASAFYGPFRDAVKSKSNLGRANKRTYQMDIRNSREALREIELDIKEGADIIMIKPGMSYLDIIYAAKQRFDIPVFAYQVSGEYAMLKAASKAGILDFEETIMESITALKRAGATTIFTYAAIEIAEILNV